MISPREGSCPKHVFSGYFIDLGSASDVPCFQMPTCRLVDIFFQKYARLEKVVVIFFVSGMAF